MKFSTIQVIKKKPRNIKTSGFYAVRLLSNGYITFIINILSKYNISI